MHSDVNPNDHVPDDSMTNGTNCNTGNAVESVAESMESKLEKATVELNFMHNENDRMKTTLEMEKVKLRDEYERIILQKEKDLSATLQKLDEQKQEYQTNLQHVQHKVDEAFMKSRLREMEISIKTILDKSCRDRTDGEEI